MISSISLGHHCLDLHVLLGKQYTYPCVEAPFAQMINPWSFKSCPRAFCLHQFLQNVSLSGLLPLNFKSPLCSVVIWVSAEPFKVGSVLGLNHFPSCSALILIYCLAKLASLCPCLLFLYTPYTANDPGVIRNNRMDLSDLQLFLWCFKGVTEANTILSQK